MLEDAIGRVADLVFRGTAIQVVVLGSLEGIVVLITIVVMDLLMDCKPFVLHIAYHGIRIIVTTADVARVKVDGMGIQDP